MSKNTKKRKSLSWLFCILALGIACVLPLTKAVTHASPALSFAVTSPFDLDEKRVDIDVRLFDSLMSKRAFGIDYPQREIQPVYLTIHNHTAKPYLVRPEHIDLPLMDVNKMANKEGRGGRIARSILFRIGGFFFWPISIPGTIDSILSSKAQSKFSHEIHAKALKEETIAPYSTVHRVFFVANDVLRDFTVTLAGTEETETLRYDVALA